MRLAVCVDSVVLSEAVGGGSSLRDRGRLEGGGISPRWPAEREGGWVWLFQVVSCGSVCGSCDALCTVLSLISALITQAAMLA